MQLKAPSYRPETHQALNPDPDFRRPCSKRWRAAKRRAASVSLARWSDIPRDKEGERQMEESKTARERRERERHR